MRIQRIFKFSVPFAIAFLILAPIDPARAASSSLENHELSFFDDLRKTLKEGKRTPKGGHLYWDEGLHFDSPDENFRLKVGGHMSVDMGYINSGGDVEEAFSDFDGFDPDFRRLKFTAFATLFDAVDFKVDIDFANIRTINDIWIRYTKNPFLRHFTLGHQEEPFSLEKLTSSTNITFLETALPIYALSLGYDIGIRYDATLFDKNATFSAGFFFNTGSINSVKDPQDRISEANGYNITARLTGLAWYEEEGRSLLHLGSGLSWGSRNSGEKDALRLSSLPESYIADRTLVDTEEFFADSVYRINPELAVVSGPLSFQTEFAFFSADTDADGDIYFWGHYMYASYFFTGEHRTYDKSKGIFSRVHPKKDFSGPKKTWGAWEVGLRLSFIDLNDESIRGGKETNITLGLNWYLNSNIRMMFNYIHANVKDRSNSRVIDDGTANIFQTRFQVSF